MSTETTAPGSAGHSSLDTERRANNRSLLIKLAVVVAGMFAFGFALVPFYEKICQATGLRNIDQADQVKNTQVDLSRSIRIEFDTNLRNLNWQFKSEEPIISVHPGEVREAMFEVVNRTDHAITGQAIPSYGPREAAAYFRKLECFCFAKQTLQAGERREMPVVFVVDPSLPADVPTITLSYTFFEVEGNGRG